MRECYASPDWFHLRSGSNFSGEMREKNFVFVNWEERVQVCSGKKVVVPCCNASSPQVKGPVDQANGLPELLTRMNRIRKRFGRSTCAAISGQPGPNGV